MLKNQDLKKLGARKPRGFYRWAREANIPDLRAKAEAEMASRAIEKMLKRNQMEQDAKNRLPTIEELHLIFSSGESPALCTLAQNEHLMSWVQGLLSRPRRDNHARFLSNLHASASALRDANRAMAAIEEALRSAK